MIFADMLKGLGKRKTDVPEQILPKGIVRRREAELIRLWDLIYRGRAPWLSGGECGLGLASAIASETARLVTNEAELFCRGSKAAELVYDCLEKELVPKLRIDTEYACATGGIVFKPRCEKGRLLVDVIDSGSFIPTETDGSGRITGACFTDVVLRDDETFFRVEEHGFRDGGYLITNKTYSRSDGGRIRGVSLSSVPEWKSIEDEVFIKGIERPLFSYFAIPLGNTEVKGSPLGISVFARAVPLIREADRQFGRLLWEFEGGELAIDASEDAFRLDRDGKPVLPLGKERLFRTNNLDQSSSDETMKVFSPALRDGSLINGLDRIIRAVEDLCGIARGTFSDPSAVTRTATEIRSMRQRTFVTVKSIEESLADAVRGLALSLYDLALLYGLCDEGEIEAGMIFGDGVLSDSLSERSSDLEEVKNGVMTVKEFREKWKLGDGKEPITEGGNKDA